MSRLDELKDQLKASFTQINDKVQESESYAKLQDRYQSLNPHSQKLVWLGGAALILFLTLSYPLSQISTSQDMIISFEEKRSLIRDLFKTYREASGRAIISVPPSIESLKAAVESILSGANLIPEQRVGVIQSSVEGRLIPSSLVSSVLEIKLAKLNLKQIVDIGTSIAAISESVKMKDLLISAHPHDTRYYDVTYKMYSLNVPEVAPEPPPEIETRPRKSGTPAGTSEDSE
ncbi:MAG: hypothetical protein A2622_11350 [Bdellovibrionales bacterium RIFCSPHIGHO2_01_FULL_40_29]|nr:MAG: hypothetical protein A2622_11350 [Bdellovibrionales bacterium RIFCSPHIGHO2_01_FULL_40_29]OFZ34544.1 MAG: hypothetical protein A3D17_01615 [Bdellovibrionales bacterium RIFCSPHIGHO2_02_FULL_40_15]